MGEHTVSEGPGLAGKGNVLNVNTGNKKVEASCLGPK